MAKHRVQITSTFRPESDSNGDIVLGVIRPLRSELNTLVEHYRIQGFTEIAIRPSYFINDMGGGKRVIGWELEVEGLVDSEAMRPEEGSGPTP
jgi:hypothetical protein